MERWIRQGSRLFALGMVAFGVISATYVDVPPGNADLLSVVALETVPAWVPGRAFLPYLTGGILAAAGVSILANVQARWGAVALATTWMLWVVLLHGPRFVNPRDPGVWTATFETLALAGIALILAGATNRRLREQRSGADVLIRLGRLCVGVSLPVFGVQHFIYADFVATLVPAWLPGRLFWAYFTGAAHCAAGVAIVTGVTGRLAAILAGVMFGSWVFIVHLPLVAVDLGRRPGWTSLFVAIAMWGGAWLVAQSLAKGEADVRS